MANTGQFSKPSNKERPTSTVIRPAGQGKHSKGRTPKKTKRKARKVELMYPKTKRVLADIQQTSELLNRIEVELCDLKIRTPDEEYELRKALHDLFISIEHGSSVKAQRLHEIDPSEITQRLLDKFANSIPMAKDK